MINRLTSLASSHLYEPGAGVLQLVQPVVVRSVHHSEQRPVRITYHLLLRNTHYCTLPGLQRDAAGVDVLDQLPEHVGLELLDDERLVLFVLALK